MGLIVAPSCDDCHGVHDIKRAVDRDSPINHANVAKTCGKCHLGIEQTYDQSIHGQLLAKGDPRGPVCTDCHTAHEIVNPEGNNFKAISDERCGKCHADRLAHYRDTYHGKAMALGRPNVAPGSPPATTATAITTCCRRPIPRSRLPKPTSWPPASNVIPAPPPSSPNTSRTPTRWTAKNYPLLHAVFLGMTGLLIGTFAFFGLHTLGWLVRAVYLYLHDSKKFREAKIQTQVDGEWFTRFSPFERFLHFLVVTSFLLLVITGMPLKFYYTDWAKMIFHIIGGPETARTLHRLGAIVTFLYFGLHLACADGQGLERPEIVARPGGRPISIQAAAGKRCSVPTRWCPRCRTGAISWRTTNGSSAKARSPQFDRWTYWEKFDYFAVFWGVAIIGASGLIMWFPDFFTRFLPGWIINIALILHSDEALLAAGFIFSIHFFNTHFRIEKFPMDTVIFSGRVSKNRDAARAQTLV